MSILYAILAVLLLTGFGLIFAGLYRLDKETGSISRMLRRYGIWLEKQNAIFREYCNQRRLQHLYQQATIDFPLVAGLAYQALCDCAETIGAVVPRDMYCLVDSPHIIINGNDMVVFRFRFRQRRGSGMSARDIQRNIQYELDRSCYHNNVPRLIVHVTLTPDSVALFQVAWEADLMEVQKSKVEI